MYYIYNKINIYFQEDSSYSMDSMYSIYFHFECLMFWFMKHGDLFPQKMSLHVVCVQGNGSVVQLVNYPLFYLTDPVDESKLYPNRSMINNQQVDAYNKVAIDIL